MVIFYKALDFGIARIFIPSNSMGNHPKICSKRKDSLFFVALGVCHKETLRVYNTVMLK